MRVRGIDGLEGAGEGGVVVLKGGLFEGLPFFLGARVDSGEA